MSKAMKLPTGDKLAKVMKEHAEREAINLTYRYVRWSIGWYYLVGYRHFKLVDPYAGTVKASWRTKNQKLQFQFQKMLKDIDDVSGRLASNDMRPAATRDALDITSVRSRSVAQIIADHLVSNTQLDGSKTKFFHILTALGCCGITGHLEEHPTIGLTGDLEVIHPLELMPFPSLGQDYTKERGLMRQHYVPLADLRRAFPGKITSKKLERMEWVKQQPGEELPDPTLRGQSSGRTPTDGSGQKSEETEQGLVLVRELWIDGPRDTCAYYAVASGEVMITEQDNEGTEVYCPIGMARFIENGTFHGAGLIDVLYSINREAENMLEQLFTNIRDIDQYGWLVMPRGTIQVDPQIRDIGKGLRVVDYEADPVTEGFKPFHVAPFNSGDVPGKTASFAMQVMEQMNPHRDLIREKGRIDSAAGLNFLDELINQSLSNATRQSAAAYGRCYRELVRGSLGRLQNRAIPITNYSVELAGAIVSDDGTITFPKNPLPNMSQINFTVRGLTPRSGTARVQQAVEFVMNGMMDPMEFRLFLVKENHDVAMWLDADRAAVQSVTINILKLFGDGVENQQIVVADYLSKPEQQLMVLEGFLGSPILSLASNKVIEDLSSYREALIRYTGMVLRNAMPNPDDGAILSTMLQEQMQQTMGPMSQRVAESPTQPGGR